VHDEVDAGRLLAQGAHEVGEEEHVEEVGRGEVEGALCGGGCEGSGGGDGPLQLDERGAQRGLQGFGEGCGRHRAAEADEERIAEVFPQPPEGVAHGGLADPDLTGRAGDAAGPQQDIEADQQVEVHAAEVEHRIMHTVHVHMKATYLGSYRRPTYLEDVPKNQEHPMNQRKIVVFGATGGTGREVLRLAAAAGHHVTAFVRDPARLGDQPTDLTIITGDVTDRAAVRTAVAGQDAVLSCLGAPASSREQVRARGTASIVAAMEQAGVQRLVSQSTYGIAETAAHLPWLLAWIIVPFYLKRAFQDHEEQERIVRGTALDWTLVRPPNLTDGPATGDVTAAALLDRRGAMKVSRADVAAFMLAQLDDPTWIRQAPAIV
jgi:putative NADH-flavin reductase